MDNNTKLSNIYDDTNLDYNVIQKMIFIFNALQDGWTVRKLDKNKFELMKDKEHITKEVVLEDCVKEFIKLNIKK